MNFSEVVGQTAIKDQLSELIGLKKLPHALLLQSNEGRGGLPLALAIAKNLVCEKRNRSEEADSGGMFGAMLPPPEPLTDACGTCPACQKAEKLIHPDIHFTFPVYRRKSDSPALSYDFIQEWRSAVTQNPYMNLIEWLQATEAENKQGNISVAECHEIIKRVNLKPYEANSKVQIIWMAEQLRETGNTLLKVIEEPPADTIFIFVVEQIELMLNTILSRTQIVKLPPISDEDMIEYLTKALSMLPDQALRVARIAEGNLNSALALAHSDGNAYEQLLQKWLSTSIRLIGPHAAESSVQLQALTDEFAALGREHQKAFVKYALWFLREIALLNNGLTSEKLFGNELTFATRVAQALNVDKLLAIQKKLNDLHYHIERNANPKIAFYGISFELYRIFTQK
jgi:DNA polymerase-3 subunit delta'